MKKGLVMAFIVVLGSMSAALAVPKAILLGLDDDDFKTRTKAQKSLEQWANKNKKTALSDMAKVYKNSKSPELRSRVLSAIRKLYFELNNKRRGFIGIAMQGELYSDAPNVVKVGVRVTEVHSDTPAEKAGLVVGDMITKIDAIDFQDLKLREQDAATRLVDYIKKNKGAGEKVKLSVMRDNKIVEIKVTLADYQKSMRKIQGEGGIDPFLLDREMMREEEEKKAKQQAFKAWAKQNLLPNLKK